MKNILVAESSTHHKILENVYYLLKGKCNLDFYIVETKHYDYRIMFPSSVNVNVESSGFRGLFFFLGLIVRARRYDFVYISTGPEYDTFFNFITIPSFFIYCLLYGKKTIITVRNIPPYFKNSTVKLSWLNNFALRFVKGFTFETFTMKNHFIKLLNLPHARYSVSYDRYPDVGVIENEYASDRRIKPSIRIGLLGSISELRRDYDLIFASLEHITKSSRETIEFVILGGCELGHENLIIRRLKELARVDLMTEVLSENDFRTRGLSCDVLLAPLSKNKAYGTLNGTGSIGDAIYLKRKLIIPAFVDPELEFNEFCLYYHDATELARQLSELCLISDHSINNLVFSKYETNNVYKTLISDLSLCKPD